MHLHPPCQAAQEKHLNLLVLPKPVLPVLPLDKVGTTLDWIGRMQNRRLSDIAR